MTRFLSVAALAALALAPAAARAQAPKQHEFFFKPGDRVVFLGDSITTL